MSEPLLLGEILIQKGWLHQKQLDEALCDQKTNKEFLGMILLRKGFITEQQLALALSEQFHFPFRSIKDVYIDWDWVMKFDTALVLEHKCFPLSENEASTTFAITNPLDAWAMAKATEQARSRRIQFVLVLESEMQEVLTRYRQQVNIRIRHLLDRKD